jgi:hypothetical protein
VAAVQFHDGGEQSDTREQPSGDPDHYLFERTRMQRMVSSAW